MNIFWILRAPSLPTIQMEHKRKCEMYVMSPIQVNDTYVYAVTHEIISSYTYPLQMDFLWRAGVGYFNMCGVGGVYYSVISRDRALSSGGIS